MDEALTRPDMFVEARRKAESTPTPDLLPKYNLELIPETKRGAMFDLAMNTWSDSFDRSTFTQHLSESRESTNPEDLQYFKSVRKYGLILRSAYDLFDQRHYTPPPLHNLLRTLGRFNDRFHTDKKIATADTLSRVLENDYRPDTELDF